MNVFLSRKGHQDYAIVIDKTGKIRGMFDATSNSRLRANAQKLLVKCLAEEPPTTIAAMPHLAGQHRRRIEADEMRVDRSHACSARRPSDRACQRVAQCDRDRAAARRLRT